MRLGRRGFLKGLGLLGLGGLVAKTAEPAIVEEDDYIDFDADEWDDDDWDDDETTTSYSSFSEESMSESSISSSPSTISSRCCCHGDI